MVRFGRRREVESFWRRNRWLKWVARRAAGGRGGGLAVVVAVLLHRAEPFLRARIVEELQERFHARVELDSFHVSLGEWIVGRGQGTAHLAAGTGRRRDRSWTGGTSDRSSR